MLPAGIGIRMKHVENRFFDRLRRRRFHEHTVRPSFPDRYLCSSVASRAGNDEAHMGQLWLGPDKLEQLEPADRLHSPIGKLGVGTISPALAAARPRRSAHGR